MSCQGCVGAVDRVLKKMPGETSSQLTCVPGACIYLLNSFSLLAGVESVHIDLPSQKVLVKGNVTPEAVVQQVSKTGKPTELWS